MKATIVGGDYAVESLFKSYGFDIVPTLDDSDLVVFTGGADVSPSLYNAERHSKTFIAKERDRFEVGVFNAARLKKLPCVGICRGGQLLNVLSGGEMYQHVTNHTRSHDLVDLISGDVIYVTSTHHQMMKPSKKAKIIAVANENGSREWWENGVFKRDVSTQDIEVVYYESTNSLCFQPHPEYAYRGHPSPMRDYFRNLIKKYLGV